MWKRKLIKNKIYSLLLIGIGVLSILIEYDATFFIFSLMLGVPIFFAKENWIMDGGYSRHVSKEIKRKSIRSELNIRREKGYGHRNQEAAR